MNNVNLNKRDIRMIIAINIKDYNNTFLCSKIPEINYVTEYFKTYGFVDINNHLIICVNNIDNIMLTAYITFYDLNVQCIMRIINRVKNINDILCI